MGGDKSTDLVASNFAAWNAHDADKVASLYTEDVVYEDVAFGMVAHGRAEMRKMAADFFASVPDFKLEVVSNTSAGNRGSVEWVFSGTDVGLYKTGKKFSVRGASIYELRGGRFSANRNYLRRGHPYASSWGAIESGAVKHSLLLINHVITSNPRCFYRCGSTPIPAEFVSRS
jgi:steroid delta-isomerase-like uncharacterized protein